MTARLSIRRLALHGFSRAEAVRVEAGFRAELARVEPAALPRAQTEPRLGARIERRGTPEHVGAEAARALIASLKP